MICPKCNIRYETGKFCPKCGTALTEENQIAVLKADASLEEKAVVESQIPEIIVPSIEVISSIGKADCDFTNVEQRKKWYIPAVISLLILILFMGYYLGHSELEQPENIDSLSSNISIASLLIEGVRGEELDSRIKYADLLKSKMDAANLNFFQIDSIYYDSYRKKIVYNLSSPLGRTSLLVKPIITVEKNELKISLQSPTLGKWQIPFPGFLIANFSKQYQIDFKSIFFADIESISLEEIDFRIKGKIKSAEIENIFGEFQENADAFFVQYLVKEKGIHLPAHRAILEYAEGKEWRSILSDWTQNIYEVPNWLLIIPENKLEPYFSFAEFLLNKSGISKFEKIKSTILKEKKDTEKELAEYKEQKLSDQLIKDAEILFSNLYRYHKDRGVPAYYLASKGKLYSQVLQEYIDLYKIKPDNDIRWNAYELYAYGTEPVIGVNVNKEFWYVKETDEYTVLKKSKEEFLKGIKYVPEQLNGNLLLSRGHADRTAIAQVVSTSLGTQNKDDIFIQYLASDGNFAFLIASPDYDRQKVEQYFLQKQNGYWQIMRKFVETQSIREEMDKEIASQNFNVCILPPYETRDFQRNYLSDYDLYELEWAQYLETGVVKNINYYSSIGNNAYITFDADSKFLYVNGNRVYIARTEKAADYFQYLDPHSFYENYRPIFLFYQD